MLEHAYTMAWLSRHFTLSSRYNLPALKATSSGIKWLAVFHRCSNQQEVLSARS